MDVVGTDGTLPPDVGGDSTDTGRLPLFAAVLREGSESFHWLRRRTESDFLAQHRAFESAGLVLKDFEVTLEAGEIRFSGLWVEGAARQKLEVGLARSLLAAHDEAAFRAGLFPFDVETYNVAGERRFAALWSSDVPESRSLLDLNAAEVRAVVADSTRTLSDIESWIESGGRQYWVLTAPSDRESHVSLSQTWDGFREEIGQRSAAGFRLRELELEVDGRSPLFSAVWEPGVDAFWLFVGPAEPCQDARLRSLGLPIAPEHEVECHFAAPCSHAPDTPTSGTELGLLSGADLPCVHLPRAPLHVVDFAITRRPVRDPSLPEGGTPHHRGVLHDGGGSGPGGG